MTDQEQPKPKYVTGKDLKGFLGRNYVSFQQLREVLAVFPEKVKEYATGAVRDYIAPIGFFRRLLGIPDDAKVEELQPQNFLAGYESLQAGLKDLKDRLEKLETQSTDSTRDPKQEAPSTDSVEQAQTAPSLSEDATALLKLLRGDEQTPGLAVTLQNCLADLSTYKGLAEDVSALRKGLYGEDGQSGLKKDLQNAQASIGEIGLALEGTETEPGIRGDIEGYRTRLREVNEGLEKALTRAGEISAALEKLETAPGASQEPVEAAALPASATPEDPDFKADALDFFEKVGDSLADPKLQETVKELRKRHIS